MKYKLTDKQPEYTRTLLAGDMLFVCVLCNEAYGNGETISIDKNNRGKCPKGCEVSMRQWTRGDITKLFNIEAI